MVVSTETVNAWTLRCIFNRSRINARCATGEFTAVRTRAKTTPNNPLVPAGTVSETWMYRDRNNNDVARTHRYVFPNGVSTPRDPKSVKIGNVKYKVSGDPTKDNPEQRFKRKWMQKCY